MVSDNAKTFKSTAKNLVSLFDLQEVQEHFSNNRIEWSFILAKAPRWGRFFERLISGVKSSLKKVLGQSKATFDELYTILTKVEAVLNSQPLTNQCSDNIEEPLTLSHLVLGRQLLTLPLKTTNDQEQEFGSKETLTKRTQHLARQLQHFWQRWKRKYLLDLREFHRKKAKQVNLPVISLGDLVSVHDSNIMQQGFWTIRKVEELCRGKDGEI